MLKEVKLQLEELNCPDCARKIQQALNAQQGVEKAEVIFTTGNAKVKFDDSITTLDRIKKVIQGFGYNVIG